MGEQNKVSGVVLAGGEARRMGREDKGLILFNRQPLIAYALAAMAEVTQQMMISANRNLEAYGQFGYPLVTDQRPGFDGPLAGILAAMQASRHEVLLVLPCDTPLLGREHLERLLAGLDDETEIAVASDGERLHPVVMAVRTRLRDDLAAYLDSGERKLQCWLQRHRWQAVDFGDRPALFANVNSPEQLAQLEAEAARLGFSNR